MDTYEKVIQMISTRLGCDPENVTMEKRLEDLGIDDLETTEIIMELEDELCIDLCQTESLQTVQDLVEFVEEQVNLMQTEESTETKKKTIGIAVAAVAAVAAAVSGVMLICKKRKTDTSSLPSA